MKKFSGTIYKFIAAAVFLQSIVWAQTDIPLNRFRIQISGLWGNRIYSGESEALDDVARSKYAYGYSASLQYCIPMEPKIEVGLEWSGFYDYVKWRRDWVPEENTMKHDMTGERNKSGRSLKATSGLYLFRKDKFVNPYVGASFGIFWAHLYRVLGMKNVNLMNEPENRYSIPDEVLDYSYKGYALELKAGINREFSFIPVIIFAEIRRSYHIISSPAIYGTRGDDNLNYYAFALGLMFRL